MTVLFMVHFHNILWHYHENVRVKICLENPMKQYYITALKKKILLCQQTHSE